MAARTLIGRVDEAATEALGALGFRKRTEGLYTTDLGDDVLGVVGLNTATEHQPKGMIEVNPIVGIRHQGIERMVAELRGEPFHPYIPPTVTIALGYLMPERRYAAWTIDTNSGALREHVQPLVEAVAKYGLPFMKQNRDLQSLSRLIDEGTGYNHQLVYRRPVAYLLAGDERRAREILDASVAKLGARSDPAAEQLRHFAAALRPRLAA